MLVRVTREAELSLHCDVLLMLSDERGWCEVITQLIITHLHDKLAPWVPLIQTKFTVYFLFQTGRYLFSQLFAIIIIELQVCRLLSLLCSLHKYCLPNLNSWRISAHSSRERIQFTKNFAIRYIARPLRKSLQLQWVPSGHSVVIPEQPENRPNLIPTSRGVLFCHSLGRFYRSNSTKP